MRTRGLVLPGMAQFSFVWLFRLFRLFSSVKILLYASVIPAKKAF